jgi:hypothetical protein
MPKSRSLRSLLVSPSRTAPPGPPSPTFSDATDATGMPDGTGPEKIITRAQLKASVGAFEKVCSHGEIVWEEGC